MTLSETIYLQETSNKNADIFISEATKVKAIEIMKKTVTTSDLLSQNESLNEEIGDVVQEKTEKTTKRVPVESGLPDLLTKETQIKSESDSQVKSVSTTLKPEIIPLITNEDSEANIDVVVPAKITTNILTSASGSLDLPITESVLLPVKPKAVPLPDVTTEKTYLTTTDTIQTMQEPVDFTSKIAKPATKTGGDSDEDEYEYNEEDWKADILGDLTVLKKIPA